MDTDEDGARRKPSTTGFFRMQHELEREKRLTEASYALHTTLDLGEILQLILSAACDGVLADRGTVFVMSKDRKEIWSQVLKGDQSLEIRVPLGRGLAGTVAETGETIRLDDAYDDERFDRSWDAKTGFRTRQVLCHAIRNRDGNIVGVFQLLNKREGLFDESDEAYLSSLSIHAALALENAQLHVSALEKERQDREILLVQEVQRAYQPEQSTLEVEGLRAAGMNILCEDASGDYYDFIPLEGERYAIVIGDVSGHGLKSALIMAQARAFLRAYCSTVASLADVINRLDASLAQDMAAGRFMCLFIAVCDPASGEMTWCNAGNPPPLLRRVDGSVENLDPTGRILGVMPDASHKAGAAKTLAVGDSVLLYTDGATEACAPDGTMFEEDRLRDLVASSADLDPADILVAVRDALIVWTGVEQMNDDLTMVAIKKT